MAGGVNAAIVPCMNCAGPAVRHSEGWKLIGTNAKSTATVSALTGHTAALQRRPGGHSLKRKQRKRAG